MLRLKSILTLIESQTKFFLFISLTVLVFIGALGCASKPKPLFWKLEKEGQTSYLFGTLHAGIPAGEISPEIIAKLESSATFVTELDSKIKAPMDPRAALELSNLSQDLDQMISRPAWEKLKLALPNFPEERLKRANPLFAIYLLDQVQAKTAPPVAGQTPAPAKPAQNPSESLDMELVHIAKDKGLVISFLEERSETLRSCIDMATAKELEDRLLRPNQNSEAEEKVAMDSLITAYKKGDLHALRKMEEEQENDAGQVGECSVASRNESWADKIDRMQAAYAPLFISVGVGHLVTNQSLLSRLESKGFKLQRLDLPAPPLPPSKP